MLLPSLSGWLHLAVRKTGDFTSTWALSLLRKTEAVLLLKAEVNTEQPGGSAGEREAKGKEQPPGRALPARAGKWAPEVWVLSDNQKVPSIVHFSCSGSKRNISCYSFFLLHRDIVI